MHTTFLPFVGRDFSQILQQFILSTVSWRHLYLSGANYVHSLTMRHPFTHHVLCLSPSVRLTILSVSVEAAQMEWFSIYLHVTSLRPHIPILLICFGVCISRKLSMYFVFLPLFSVFIFIHFLLNILFRFIFFCFQCAVCVSTDILWHSLYTTLSCFLLLQYNLGNWWNLFDAFFWIRTAYGVALKVYVSVFWQHFLVFKSLLINVSICHSC